MEFPYRIIESKISLRNEFVMTDGCQPTHALFFLKVGRFLMELEGRKEEIGAGDCVILPNYVHFRRNVVDPIEFVYIKFSENQNCPFNMQTPFGKIQFQDQERFVRNITKLEALLDRDDAVSVAFREHLLMDILFQFHFEHSGEMCSTNQRRIADKTVATATAHISRHLGDKLLIEDVCAAAGTNPSTLNLKFHREFGMSIGQYIIRERIKKARHLLVSSTYRICEIADRCGFENVYYFSNAFKRNTGVSPTEYRLQRK